MVQQQTLLSRQDLAKRWGLAIKTIEKYESEGIISRIKGIPVPRYNLESILKIEESEEYNPMSPVERNALEKEILILKKKLHAQNELLKKYSVLGAETINLVSTLGGIR